jgi:hypothetical protein
MPPPQQIETDANDAPRDDSPHHRDNAEERHSLVGKFVLYDRTNRAD